MYDALVAMEAPPRLIAWVSSHVRVDAADADLIDTATNPTWFPWMTAAAGLPLRAAVDVAIATLRQDVAALDIHRTLLLDTLDAAEAVAHHRGTPDAAIEAAERSEDVARQPNTVYRTSTPSPLVSELAAACAYTARASEALFSAELALSTQRLVEAQRSGALIGMGTNAMVGPERALCLAGAGLATDPILTSAVYVPAALSEALAHLAQAREMAQGDRGGEVRTALARELARPIASLFRRAG